MLGKNSIYATIILTVIWVILRESVTVDSIVMGLIVALFSVYFGRKLIPKPQTPKINVLSLMAYLLFLFLQIYVAGYYAIKLILIGAEVDIVEIKTKASTLFFRTLLVNSITLVPGSIALDLSEDRITVLWLRQKNGDPKELENADEILLGKLERMLLRAER